VTQEVSATRRKGRMASKPRREATCSADGGEHDKYEGPAARAGCAGFAVMITGAQDPRQRGEADDGGPGR